MNLTTFKNNSYLALIYAFFYLPIVLLIIYSLNILIIYLLLKDFYTHVNLKLKIILELRY